jgi:hypothetical protein
MGTLEQSLQAGLIQILKIMKHLNGSKELKALRCPLLGDESERAQWNRVPTIIHVEPSCTCRFWMLATEENF